MPDRRAPRVQRPAVQRRPPVIVGRVDQVGDHDMGVQMRIPSAGGPVPEPGGHEPVAVDHPRPARPPPSPARHPLEHRQRPSHGGVMGVADLIRGLRVAQREQQRHRLGRAERGIEPGDHRHRPGTGEPVAARRIHMRQQPPQRLGVDRALQPEPSRGRAHPHTGRLLGARVVVLEPPSDRLEVVLLLAVRQLPQAQHGRLPSTSRRTRRQGTARASASEFLGRVLLRRVTERTTVSR